MLFVITLIPQVSFLSATFSIPLVFSPSTFTFPSNASLHDYSWHVLFNATPVSHWLKQILCSFLFKKEASLSKL